MPRWFGVQMVEAESPLQDLGQRWYEGNAETQLFLTELGSGKGSSGKEGHMEHKGGQAGL